MALFPILFGIGRERKALMLCHSSSKHIGVIFLINNEIPIFVMIEKARSKFIELETTTTLPI